MWLTDVRQTLHAIRLVDVLDIMVVAFLLYMVLLWFRRTKAAFVARGIFICVLLYAVATQAGMYLTTWMFQGFFAVSLVALVVIFQDELRSFFERLAVWSLRRQQESPQRPEIVDMLVHTLSQFARQRIGALVVLKGRDPLERHVEGGEALDGQVSEVLLESLFDPHSGGHDGAVILEHGRVTQFAAHLPLSKEFTQLARMGTRHAAALGLSERTDALCLVVSEERGVVSVAQGGNMRPVQNFDDLAERLSAFVRATAPAQRQIRWYDAFRHYGAEKVLALGMATALWLIFVQGFQWGTEVYQVPVSAHTTADDITVASVRPSTVNATLKGLKRNLRLLNPLALRAIITLPDTDAGTRMVRVTSAHLQVPGAVQLTGVDPPVVEVDLTKSDKPFLGIFGTKTAPTEP